MAGILLKIDTFAPALGHRNFGASFGIGRIFADELGIDFGDFFAAIAFFDCGTDLSRFALGAASTAIHRIFIQFGTDIAASRLTVCTSDCAFSHRTRLAFAACIAAFAAVILILKGLHTSAPAYNDAFLCWTSDIRIDTFARLTDLIGIARDVAITTMMRIAVQIEAEICPTASRTLCAA